MQKERVDQWLISPRNRSRERGKSIGPIRDTTGLRIRRIRRLEDRITRLTHEKARLRARLRKYEVMADDERGEDHIGEGSLQIIPDAPEHCQQASLSVSESHSSQPDINSFSRLGHVRLIPRSCSLLGANTHSRSPAGVLYCNLGCGITVNPHMAPQRYDFINFDLASVSVENDPPFLDE